VPPPSEKSPQYDIPKEVDAVVMKAIAKRPAERYQSMRELIADIRALTISVS